MLQAVWTVGIVLAAIAAMDRRAWPSLALLALVFVQAAISNVMLRDVLSQLAMRPAIDLAAGVLSLGLVTRERWTLIMPAMFALMMLGHAAFWMARGNEIDLWLPYAHSQNALLIVQLIGLAWPSGGRLVGRVGSWIGDLLASRRGRNSPLSAASYEVESENDRPAHVRSSADVFLSSGARV
jgi:hypothetical protein